MFQETDLLAGLQCRVLLQLQLRYRVLGHTRGWDAAGKSFAFGGEQRREACVGHGCWGKGMVWGFRGSGGGLAADQHQGRGAGQGLWGGSRGPPPALCWRRIPEETWWNLSSRAFGWAEPGRGGHHLEGPWGLWQRYYRLRDQVEAQQGCGRLVGSLTSGN